MDRLRKQPRHGFTLIELIVALISASILVASLAATIMISTRLLETPPDNASVWHDRAITDRLASDLRYATDVDENSGNGFQITRANPESGTLERIWYQTSADGLTRQVESGPAVPYDTEAPASQFQVDGYTAPTLIQSSQFARVRSTNTAATNGITTSIDIDLPPSCQEGDLLLLCISARTPDRVDVDSPGWQTISTLSVSNSRAFNYYQIHNSSIPETLTLNISPASSIAAAILAIENANTSSPIDWRDTATPYAWPVLPQFNPTILEDRDGFLAGQLNVQVFAGDGDPWPNGTLGVASFTDVVRVTGGNGSSQTSVGVAVRTGPSPEITTTPRLWQAYDYGYVLHTGIRVGVEQ